MKITLVRHGQTDCNYEDVMQGRANHLLNDTGRRQCQKLREKLKDVSFDYCYMSPLIRAVETAFILVGDRVETFPDSRLIERDLGEYEGKPRSSYDAKKYWDYDLNSSDLGVEEVSSLFSRCQDFLDYVKEKDYQHILVVSHGAVIRSLRYLLLGHPLSGNLCDGDIPNCYCETIEEKKNRS